MRSNGVLKRVEAITRLKNNQTNERDTERESERARETFMTINTDSFQQVAIHCDTQEQEGQILLKYLNSTAVDNGTAVLG